MRSAVYTLPHVGPLNVMLHGYPVTAGNGTAEFNAKGGCSLSIHAAKRRALRLRNHCYAGMIFAGNLSAHLGLRPNTLRLEPAKLDSTLMAKNHTPFLSVVAKLMPLSLPSAYRGRSGIVCGRASNSLRGSPLIRRRLCSGAYRGACAWFPR
jgi:hypothetical protein